MTGKEILSLETNSVNIDYLAKGIYIVMATDGHKVESFKIVK